MFTVGASYTRHDVYQILGVPESQRDGDWLNGYHRHGDDYFIFCNVGTPGRTGHDHGNRWDGERLVWFGKKGSHFGQNSIRELISGNFDVLIFCRRDARAPFVFAGKGKAVPYPTVENPARVDWVFGSKVAINTTLLPDELGQEPVYEEGTRTAVLVNKYERDRSARAACIAHHGAKCLVCGFDFQEHFGAIGSGFIHVHHVTPISELGANYALDPIRDLVPVCPNCHAMIHRRSPPFSIHEMRNHLVSSGANRPIKQ